MRKLLTILLLSIMASQGHCVSKMLVSTFDGDAKSFQNAHCLASIGYKLHASFISDAHIQIPEGVIAIHITCRKIVDGIKGAYQGSIEVSGAEIQAVKVYMYYNEYL